MSQSSADSSPAIESPCVRVCRIDPTDGFCNGCFRTRDEIRGWFGLSVDDKLAAIAAKRDRLAQRIARQEAEREAGQTE